MQLREARGLTQAGLGDRLGFTQSEVSKFERGERALGVLHLRAWLRTLGVALGPFAEALDRDLERLEATVGRGRAALAPEERDQEPDREGNDDCERDQGTGREAAARDVHPRKAMTEAGAAASCDPVSGTSASTFPDGSARVAVAVRGIGARRAGAPAD